MKKIQIDDCICHSQMRSHSQIKDQILHEIDRDAMSHDLKTEVDSIAKLDWNNRRYPDRPWLKIFLPEFTKEVEELVTTMSYTGINLKEAWYQQYLEGDTHQWHVHGENFTGVYYLEFPEGCSKTEVCSPYNSRIIEVDAVEGDLIVFPSHYLHRGLPNHKDRKTIVSFNFDITTYNAPI